MEERELAAVYLTVLFHVEGLCCVVWCISCMYCA